MNGVFYDSVSHTTDGHVSENIWSLKQEGTNLSNVTFTILDIIQRPVFYLKRNVSDTEFCLLVPLLG
jgi:hypothetical protein